MKFGQYLHRGFIAQAIHNNNHCLRLQGPVDRAEIAPQQITGVKTKVMFHDRELKIPVPIVVHSYATTGVQSSAQVVAISTAYLIISDQGILPARFTTQGPWIEPVTQQEVGHKVSLQDTPITTDINSCVNRQKLQQSRNIHGVTEKMVSQLAKPDFGACVKRHFRRGGAVYYDNHIFQMEPVMHCTYNIPFFNQNVLSKACGMWFHCDTMDLPIIYKKLRAMLAFSSTSATHGYMSWPKNLTCAGKMPLAVCLQQLGIPNTPQPQQLLSQYRVKQLISMLKLMYDIPIKLY